MRTESSAKKEEDVGKIPKLGTVSGCRSRRRKGECRKGSLSQNCNAHRFKLVPGFAGLRFVQLAEKGKSSGIGRGKR